MKRSVIILFVFSLLLVSCAKNSLHYTSNTSLENGPIETKALPADAVYDEISGFYLVPNEDVFELSNVQDKYERLTNNTDILLPTHKALKIIPQDDAIAHRILTDTTIWVSRVPFGFRPVAQKDVTSPAPLHNAREEGQLYDNDTNGANDLKGGAGRPLKISPIYARWPVDRPLPSGAYCQHLYDIYSPISTSKTDSLLLSTLVPKNQYRGVRPDAGNHPAWMDPWSLQIRFFDKCFNAYKNAANITVHYIDYDSYYSRTLAANTYGKVFVPEDVPMSACVFLEFYTNRFKITENDNSNYYVEYINTVDNLCDYPYELVLGSPVTCLDYLYSFRHQVFQSARYYYNGHNDVLDNISQLRLDSPLRISTYADSASLHHGGYDDVDWFFCEANPPYIEIAQHSVSSSAIFGTTSHVLGHASHYAEMDSLFNTVDERISQSLASFIGWYNVKSYYSSVLTTDIQVHAYSAQGRQWWTGGLLDTKTPIFVDLVDDYNQSAPGAQYVNDAISGVPVTDVLSFSVGPTTWSQSLYLMQQQIGVLYSSSAFNNLIMLY